MRKIRILLIAAFPYHIHDRYNRTDKLPLGTLYALEAAKRANPQKAKLLDLATVSPDFDIQRELINFAPDIIAIGIHSPATFQTASEIVFKAKQLDKSIVAIAGGVFASSQPYFCLTKALFDYVLKGEVDESLTLLIEQLQNESKLSVPGLISKNNPSGLYIKESYPDLDMLSRVPDKKFDISKYTLVDSILNNSKKTITISSARGCPHNCAYCCYSVIGNRNRRIRDKYLLVTDISSIIEDFGVDQFNFVDDDFLCSTERCVFFCDYFFKSDIKWRCQCRTDSFKKSNLKELATLMKNAGCQSISFGIESGDPYVLKKMNKSLDLNWAKSVCTNLMNLGIEVRVYIIVGLPYQNFSSVLKTLEFLRLLNPTTVSVELFVPHPGSEIGDNLEKWGIKWTTNNLHDRIQRLDWLNENSKTTPCIETNWMTSEEISYARDIIQEEWPSFISATP